MSNMELWEKVRRPPTSALKQIRGGRLSGMTDVSPQWRYQVMTENLGPCGIGWKFEIVRLWTEPGAQDQVFAFAHVHLFISADPGADASPWSDPIPGIGGSLLVAKESGGLYSNDEAFKMAVTDALSTALKMLGVAADIHCGLWDGTKYKDAPQASQNAPGANAEASRTQSQPDAHTAHQDAPGWSGVNVKGRTFKGTGRPLPSGWFARLKENRAAAIEELGGPDFGAEKNPAGKWEIVQFLPDPPAPEWDPNDDVPF